MRTRFGRPTALLVMLVALLGCGGGGVATSPEPTIGAGLSGPTGLHATIFAAGLPTVASFAFDSEGRLWVGTAAESDGGKDGVYLVAAAGATPQEVISDAHTPLGLLWYQGSLYVAASGGVSAYSGFNGTTFTSHHTILALPTDVGEENSLVLAPSGRMLLGISAPCDDCTPALPDSASIVSFLPSGGDPQIYASDIRAAVGLAFVPGTSDLLVSLDQRDDLGSATPGDWLVDVHQGSAWGFPGCYGQGGSICAGVPPPLAVLDKHGAVSDVAIVTGQLGSAIGTAALVAEWNTGRVEDVKLTQAGSDYMGTLETPITGAAMPVALIIAPDGALYIGAWGSGTIYRVTG